MALQQITQQCKACSGTGLCGSGHEAEGIGIQCHACKGTGCDTHTYEPFTGRKAKDGVRRVFQVNAGVAIQADTPGGVSYAEWLNHCGFRRGTELRADTCPAWWAQATQQAKPEWEQCSKGSCVFMGCSLFGNKAACWRRWDIEYPSA